LRAPPGRGRTGVEARKDQNGGGHGGYLRKKKTKKKKNRGPLQIDWGPPAATCRRICSAQPKELGKWGQGRPGALCLGGMRADFPGGGHVLLKRGGRFFFFPGGNAILLVTGPGGGPADPGVAGVAAGGCWWQGRGAAAHPSGGLAPKYQEILRTLRTMGLNPAKPFEKKLRRGAGWGVWEGP